MSSATTPRLSIAGVSKSFAGVRALNSVSFDVLPGEVHCICGENGAGKSTLIKILAGAYQPDEGTITVDGTVLAALQPVLAKQLGIDVIFQENLLVPTMSVLENMFVGHEPVKFGLFADFASMRVRIRQEMDFLGIDLDVNRRVETLSVAEQQFVKILKALVMKPRVLIMDEPTSMFNVEDSARVLRMVKRISDADISVIYISHFLSEVREIADRVTVIRDGSVVSTTMNVDGSIDLDQLTKDMVGRPVEMFYQKEEHQIGDVAFRVTDLKVERDSPAVSFGVREGEILGIAGMVGSGRTEIVRAIAGADRFHSGIIEYRGRRLDIRNPRQAIDAGIAHITEDRQRLGLSLGASVLENITVIGLDRRIKSWFFRVRGTVGAVKPLIEKLRIKTASPFTEVRLLSGGNQQKVVLAKWLLVDSSLLIFDEPTRGIDVNAKTEFYRLMSELTRGGKSIIMISSDMPELVSMSDRVLVVRNGGIVDELQKSEITEEAIISSALKGKQP